MPLADFRADLAAFGIVLRPGEDESSSHPEISEDARPVLALRVPPGQAIALLADDGRDPSPRAVPAPAGARLKRLLATLLEDEHIAAWHAFEEGTQVWVHVQFEQALARRFYRRVNWAANTATTSGPRFGHAFL